jgi:galactoside O-acetyltransferase
MTVRTPRPTNARGSGHVLGIVLARVADRAYPVRNGWAHWRDSLASALPGDRGVRMRQQWLRRAGVELGPDAYIDTGLELRGGENIRIGSGFSAMRNCSLRAERGSLVIGDRVALNVNVLIDASLGGTITIGDDVLIGPNVVLRASDHVFADADRPIRQQGHSGGEIVVADDVWLAASVVITAGVVVGRGAVVAAGAVVTKNVEPWTVVAGVPAEAVAVRGSVAAQDLPEPQR